MCVLSQVSPCDGADEVGHLCAGDVVDVELGATHCDWLCVNVMDSDGGGKRREGWARWRLRRHGVDVVFIERS